VTIIPDEAIVIRGGKNHPEDILRGTGLHPSGLVGISVECAVGLSIDELSSGIPHGQIGMTTVGEVRQAGGDVVRTSGRRSSHATLVGLTHEQASELLNPTMSNPSFSST
jgi:hypothetical protein